MHLLSSDRFVAKKSVVSKPLAVMTIFCAALITTYAGFVDFARLRADELSTHRDIYALWQDGGRILHGENPYARTLANTNGVNHKYSTYFPLFYLLSAGSQMLLPDYPQFILFWRTVSFAVYAGIGLILAAPFYRRGTMIVAMSVLLLWLFNRWTLKGVQLVHIDFLAIAPMLASLLLLDRHRRTSLLLLGLSLAIKHLAIFIAPLYLVWIWTAPQPSPVHRASAPVSRVGRALSAVFWIALIPGLLSLPFLILNARAFVDSILFSATRSDEFRTPAESLDDLMDWPRTRGKLLMLGMMFLIYAAAAQHRLGRFAAALLVMTFFAGFNAIWFPQYEVWPIALLPLVALDGYRLPTVIRCM
jgi:uncharacterized membrane protein